MARSGRRQSLTRTTVEYSRGVSRMRLTAAEIVGGLLLLVGTLPLGPAKPVAGQGITMQEYEPRNTLVVSEHIITSARFPLRGHARPPKRYTPCRPGTSTG